MDRIEARPRPGARTIGIVYLLYFVAAILGAVLMRGIVAPGDPATTAQHLLTHEVLYRSGFAMGLLANVIYIALAALFYRLFGPVDWSISLVGAFCGVVGCAIQIFGGILQLAPLVLLRDARLLHAFGTAQVQTIALLSLTLYAQIFSLSLVLFAFFDIFLGYLIFKSTYVPRLFGALMMVAGAGWLTFLWPPLATRFLGIIMPLGGLPEIALMLWLIVKGVDVEKWRERSSTPVAT